MIKIIALSLWIAGCAVFSLLAGLALWFHLRGPGALKIGVMAAIAALFMAYAVAVASSRVSATLTFAAGITFLAFAAGMVLWWVLMQPSLTREWAADVQHTVTADVDGSLVTVRNIRDFDWKDGAAYEARWKTGTYDLADVTGVDVLLSYWAHPAIAHTLVSFGFRDGRHLVFSAEIRKKSGQEFSSIGGFFRSYELAMIAAEERDIVYLRTDIRGERVYRYPIDVAPELMREMLLRYIAKANDLAENPSFYNTVTSNCTTVVFDLVRTLEPDFPFDYRILLSGHLPEFLYDNDLLADGGLPFEQVREKALIKPQPAAISTPAAMSAPLGATPLHSLK